MNTIDFTVTPVVRADRIKIPNLAKLGAYVQANVSDNEFSMLHFYKKLHGFERDRYDCDTIGCLLGYSPMALGIPLPVVSSRAYFNYAAFAKEWYNINDNSFIYNFLFNAAWTHIDNTRIGALKRLKFVIDHDDFNYGTEPITYTHWYKLYSTPEATDKYFTIIPLT